MLAVRPRTIIFTLGFLLILSGMRSMVVEFHQESEHLSAQLVRDVKPVDPGAVEDEASPEDSGKKPAHTESENKKPYAKSSDKTSICKSEEHSSVIECWLEEAAACVLAKQSMILKVMIISFVLFLASAYCDCKVLPIVGGGTSLLALTVLFLSGGFNCSLENAFLVLSLGGSICLLCALWHASSLSPTWVTSVGFAFRGMGALLLVLLGHWFQMQTTKTSRIQGLYELEAEDRRHSENLKAEAARAKEKIENYNRANAINKAMEFMKAKSERHQVLLKAVTEKWDTRSNGQKRILVSAMFNEFQPITWADMATEPGLNRVADSSG